LIPNLVKAVKGCAAQERESFEGVVKARAYGTLTTLPLELLSDPAGFTDEVWIKAIAAFISTIDLLEATLAERFLSYSADVDELPNCLIIL